ncbi:Exonuclease VII small subunit protein [Dioscorea alata]|uniref:Exonuclease VII small subunit protein n=1 Tax=Dioscorea alata TaxID=55571 RepID=A0ACB7UBN8_DIOAL|nr:Exonuclease VII small subunit protein [Dioscorea alata]
MKMIQSNTTTNGATSNDDTTTNDATSSDDPDESDPLPDSQPCCSIHSSSVDSNHNEEDANRDNGNILENAEVVTEAVNINTVDSMGRHTKKSQTTLKELWALPQEERVLVSANCLRQPIGPEAQLLSSFLGMLARSSQRIGLQYESWHEVPKTMKEELLNFIELRFVLDIPKDNVLKSFGKKWKDYKYDLKKQHFKIEDGLQANKEKHPEGTIRWQWEELVDFWYSKKGEESEVGIASRKQQKYTHNSGLKRFARKEKEREKTNEKLVDREGEMVETQVGLGLDPMAMNYCGYSSRRNTTASSNHLTECRDQLHQMERRIQQLEEERERERVQYKILVTFLQNQFPGANFPFPDISGPTSQSQNPSPGSQ